MTDATRRGTDSSGRGIFATDYLWNWWQGVLSRLPFDDKVVITQGAFMLKAGGGATGSAGYHDLGGCFDLRVWNLTGDEQGRLIRELRRSGAAAWLRNLEHGGFADPHIHLVLGTDSPLTVGAAAQWSEYKAGRDGLASRGEDYHWRPDPLVLTPPKPAAKPKTASIRTISFNCGTDQRGPRLRKNLRRLAKHRPHIILLQEAKHFSGTLRGYKRYATDGVKSTERGQSVILVREDGKVHKVHRFAAKGPRWRGPQGGAHDPRIFIGVSVTFGNATWDVLNVHRVWTRRGKKNMEAWAAEDAAILAWFNKRKADKPARSIALIGDHNSGKRDRFPLSVRTQARRTKGWLALAGIDGAVAIDCKAVAKKRLRKYGSDHHPVNISLTQEI